jgi:hypothetical protein
MAEAAGEGSGEARGAYQPIDLREAPRAVKRSLKQARTITQFLTNSNTGNVKGMTDCVELSGFAAILGGFIAQEIIKSFQHKPQIATQYNWLNLDLSTLGTCEAARIL